MALPKEKLEMLKCMSSPMYWIDNYGMCFNSETQKVELMKCYDYQREAIQNFENYQNNIVLKSRQCLPEGSIIETANGRKKIEDVKIGDIVYSYNKNTKEIEQDVVSDFWKSGLVKCVKVKINNKDIEVGENHPFFVNDSFIKAKDLKKRDQLLSFSGRDIFVEDVIESGERNCFDISVKKNENYFLEDTLVHNTGFSVITAAYVAWTIMFKSEQRVLILANDLISSTRLLKTVKEFIYNTPKFLSPTVIKDNEKYIEVSNKSWVKAVACSPQAGRGEALTLLIIDEAAFIENDDDIKAGALMAVSKTVGGKTLMISCVPEDTYIFTDKGVKQIRDFVEKDKSGGYEIDNYSILGKDKLRSNNLFFNNGIQTTKILKTTNSIFEGTLNHKLWACKDEKFGWYKTEELNEGDYISIQYGMEMWGDNDDTSGFKPSENGKIINIFNPKKITKETAYLIGLYISEGSTYKKKNKNEIFIGGSVTITCGDDVSKAITDCGLNYSSHDNLHYSICSKNFIEYLEYIGFDLSKTARIKEIPSRVLEMSRENIIYMLRGIFDGDGYSHKNKGIVGISMSSKKLVEQIRMLLNNFGIVTDYFEAITPPTKKVKVESPSFRVECNPSNSKVFYEKIGFNFERKQIKQEALKKYNFNKNSPNDVIPMSSKLFIKMYQESGYNTAFFKKQGIQVNGVILKKEKGENVSRGLFLKVYNLCKENLTAETIEEIEKVLSPNLKWNKINKIEYSEKETFDFSLLDDKNDFWCHSVIYNGVLGHQTPKGTGNLYHKTWSSSIKKENNYHRLTAHWTQNPTCIKGLEKRLDQETGAEYLWSPWYQEQCERLGHDKVKIAQELDLAFDSSKYLAIDAAIVAKYRDYVKKMKPLCYFDYTQRELGNEDCFTNEQNTFYVWEKPKKDSRYIIGSDVSRGDGKDYSTIQILDADTLLQVAEYQGKIASDKFAEVILAAALAYNNAFVAIEVNNMGLTTAYYLHKTLGYKNVYKSKSIVEVWTGPRDAKWKVDEGDEIPGFQTTSKTRPFLISSLKKYMKERQVKIKSQRLISEFDTFVVKENGKAEHERGSNDDLIIAFAIALFIRDTQWEQITKSKNLYEAMLGAFTHSSTPMTGIPSKNNEIIKKKSEEKLGEEMGGVGTIFNLGDEASETKKEDEDTSWLFD